MPEISTAIFISSLILVAVIMIVTLAMAYYDEKRKWNNGMCSECGSKLRLFDSYDKYDGWCCDKCNTKMWIGIYKHSRNYQHRIKEYNKNEK